MSTARMGAELSGSVSPPFAPGPEHNVADPNGDKAWQHGNHR